MSDVADRVKKIVVEHLGVEEDKVVENASFIDDLGADSLDTVELVMAFEEEFGIEIPDDAAENIRSPIGVAAARDLENGVLPSGRAPFLLGGTARLLSWTGCGVTLVMTEIQA